MSMTLLPPVPLKAKEASEHRNEPSSVELNCTSSTVSGLGAPKKSVKGNQLKLTFSSISMDGDSDLDLWFYLILSTGK